MPLNSKLNKDSKSDLKSIIPIEINKTQEPNKSLKKLLMLMNSLKILKEEECMTWLEKIIHKECQAEDSNKEDSTDSLEEASTFKISWDNLVDLVGSEEVLDNPEDLVVTADSIKEVKDSKVNKEEHIHSQWVEEDQEEWDFNFEMII